MRRLTVGNVVNLDMARISLKPYFDEEQKKHNSEKAWRWSYIKDQFSTRELEDLYKFYTHKINHGYFSIFVIIQFVIHITHLILVSIISENDYNNALLDIILYAVVIILLLVGLYVSEKYAKENRKILQICCMVSFFILFVVDIVSPIYYGVEFKSHLRPAYTTNLILGCYIFFDIQKLYISIVMGFLTSAVHILIIAFITYKDSKILYDRILAEFIFLLCFNIMGIYFKQINEIVIRKSFLDRRDCVESTVRLKTEKEQANQLLKTIIPDNILEDIRDKMTNIINTIMSKGEVQEIGQLISKPYENVTILYADIVNYTQLTSSLNGEELVKVLDDLFATFDDASEGLNVLRIKFLGDCYYCVAGLPPKCIPNHAEACVDLGLKMIKIIREVRSSRKLNIDMRIGIHTGSLVGGLIGNQKWQFDIWSNDVVIANKMETTGTPGKVHITQQTKDQLNKNYNIVLSDNSQNDELLKRNDITGYLITPNISDRRLSEIKLYQPEKRVNLFDRRITLENSKRRTAFMDNNLNKYHMRLHETNNAIKEEILKMPISKSDQWFKVKHINPLLLIFKSWDMEKNYMMQPDPLFKYYMLCQVAILISIVLIQVLIFPQWVWTSSLTYVMLFLVLFIFLPITWAHYIWVGCKGEEKFPKFQSICKISTIITKNVVYRLLIYGILCSISTTYILSELLKCVNGEHYVLKLFRSLFQSVNNFESTDCLIPWHMTDICSLVIILSFIFLRIHIWLKLAFTMGITIFYAYHVVFLNKDIFENSESYNYTMEPYIAHILSIITLTFTFHLIDRQTDYMNRLDFEWSKKLQNEEKEANLTHAANEMLLKKILPNHIAKLYLNVSREKSGLYSEECSNIAVMFASIRNYDVENDRMLLRIMDSAIKEFDNLLYDHPCVEKIKIANWTYMAAAGLHNDVDDVEDKLEPPVVKLVKFAVAMINLLPKIHENTLQDITLRIGIAHGDVTAGVIGSKKPLYDIWGDSVNVASRMDSTGHDKKIQVPQSTAQVLTDWGYTCEFRGNIYVKGKSAYPDAKDVPTYYVKLIYCSNTGNYILAKTALEN